MTLQEYAKKLQTEKAGILSNDYEEELDCLDHYFEAEGKTDYAFCADLCQRLGFTGIIDIGCAFGYQSDEFVNRGLRYHGIDDWCRNFWNQDNPLATFQTGTYPCSISIDTHGYLAVSRLCVGYLMDDYDAIASDFGCLLLMLPGKEAVEALSKRYRTAAEWKDTWSDGSTHTDKVLFVKPELDTLTVSERLEELGEKKPKDNKNTKEK